MRDGREVGSEGGMAGWGVEAWRGGWRRREKARIVSSRGDVGSDCPGFGLGLAEEKLRFISLSFVSGSSKSSRKFYVPRLPAVIS